MSHDLKQLPEGHFRCDECGMFFASTEGHNYFSKLEVAEARVKTLEDALQKAYDAMTGNSHLPFDMDGWVTAVKEAEQALAAKEPEA